VVKVTECGHLLLVLGLSSSTILLPEALIWQLSIRFSFQNIGTIALIIFLLLLSMIKARIPPCYSERRIHDNENNRSNSGCRTIFLGCAVHSTVETDGEITPYMFVDDQLTGMGWDVVDGSRMEVPVESGFTDQD